MAGWTRILAARKEQGQDVSTSRVALIRYSLVAKKVGAVAVLRPRRGRGWRDGGQQCERQSRGRDEMCRPAEVPVRRFISCLPIDGTQAGQKESRPREDKMGRERHERESPECHPPVSASSKRPLKGPPVRVSPAMPCCLPETASETVALRRECSCQPESIGA